MLRFGYVILGVMCFAISAFAEPVNIHMNCHIVDAQAQGLPSDMTNVKIVVGQIKGKQSIESLCVLGENGVAIEAKQTVIDSIEGRTEEKDKFHYYTCSGQDTAKIRVIDDAHLRTVQDDEKEDNLGALGGCRVVPSTE